MFHAKFSIEGVKKIYEHSLANPVFTPTFSQLFEGKYRKDGKDFVATDEKKWPTADDVDNSKLPQMFNLVKDQGAYLMAATEKTLPGEKTKNFVVYCEGCDPNKDEDWWDFQQRAFGGDDFGEGLPLGWLKLAIENAEECGTDVMIIGVTKDGLELKLAKPK